MKTQLTTLALIFLLNIHSFGQQWKVNGFISKIESDVEIINAKARSQEISSALDLLSKLNDEIRSEELSFQDWYKKNREENPNYVFKLNVELAPQFNVAHWREMQQKAIRNQNQTKEAFEGIKYMEILDRQDKAWSYIVTIYNSGKTIKDMIENASEGDLFSFFFTTKEGIDQFIDDYTSISNAELQELQTENKKAEMKRLLSRAKKMERNYIDFEDKVGKGLSVIGSFNDKISALRQIAGSLDQQVQFSIDWNDPRYKFDGTYYLERLKLEGNRVVNGSITWDTFKNSFLAIGKNALQNKEEVIQNILKSDDEAVKYAKRDEVNSAYEAYLKEASGYYTELEKTQTSASTEPIDLNYQIEQYETIQYPTSQGSGLGITGGQMQLSSVQAEADVQQLVNLIHSEVGEINQLGNSGKMNEAIGRLNELNRRISKDLNFDFENNYRKAREGNPQFKVEVQAKLCQQFNSAYWVNSLNKTSERLRELQNKYFSTPQSNARRYWEISYAIAKQIHDVVKLPKDAMDELQKNGKQESWNKAKEGIDGIKDNYEKLEKALLIPDNYEMSKANMKKLIDNAVITANSLSEMASFMKVNEQESSDFYALIDRLKSMKKNVESGPSKQVDSNDSRYDFNESAFYAAGGRLVKEFNDGEISWEDFDKKLSQLNREAEAQKEQVIENLKASDDLELKKQQAINTETNDWTYYYDWAVEQHTICFKKSQEKTAEKDIKPEFSWNGQKYLDLIKAAANQFKSGKGDYHSVKLEIEAINKKAETEKEQVSQNLNNPATANAIDKVNKLEDDFNEFYDLSIDVLDDCYRFEQNKGSGISQIISQNETLNSGSPVTNSEMNSSVQNEQTSTINPPGSPGKNNKYHGYWRNVDDPNTGFSFTQKGSTVDLFGFAKTTISGGKVVFKEEDKNGETRTSIFQLTDDGYKMDAWVELTDKQIYSKLSSSLAFLGSIPKQNDIDNYRKKFGVTHQMKLKYFGIIAANMRDTDHDGVGDAFDNCPDTPYGLTFDNGGVDIAGCPTVHGSAPVSATSVPSVTSNSVQQVQHNPPLQENTSSANTTTGAGAGKSSTTVQSNSSSQATTSPVNTNKAEMINRAINKNAAGFSNMCRIPVYKLKENDKIVFKLSSGVFQKFYVRWVGVSFTEVLYEETTDIVYSTAELMAKRPEKAMYLDFQVNQYSNVSCTLEGWGFPQGVPIPAEWNIKESGGGSGSNNGGNDFYELIRKADEAFNRKYWDETQGTQASSNPKQESLDFLRKAEQLISQRQNIQERYSMVLSLASKYSEYAKRVFANSAKVDFIQAAGSLLGKFGNAANAITETKTKSAAYNNIADGWRELTKAAMWGSHQYNKATCDSEAKKYYDLALREDRNDTQLQKTVEKINAPKKAVPAAVAQFKEIDNESWNQAQQEMFKLNNELAEERAREESEIHPLVIAEMTLSVGNGTVSIKRSGSDKWEEVTDQQIEIYIGDVIKTSDDATDVSVTYSADKTFLAIKSGSEVEFRDQQLNIRRGIAYIQVVKKGNKFVVVGPSSATGLRGTQAEVKVNVDKTTETYLYEGVVEIRTATDIGYLEPGQKMIAKKGEEKLQQTTFDPNNRLKTNWSELENVRRKHEQILAVSASVTNKAISSTNSNNTATDPFIGVSFNSNSTIPIPFAPDTVQFSWSPYGTFSSVMVQNQIKFGTHNIIARMPAKVNSDTPVTVNWYFNNQLVSAGNHTILPQANFFDGQIITGGEPVNPGLYKVEFLINSQVSAQGQVELIAPPKLEQEAATQLYVQSLQVMQQAFDLVDQSELYEAGIKASGVLNDLRSVMYSAPQLPDVQTVTEMCLALMSFTEMIHATNNNLEEQANEWVKRSLGHARRGNQLCKDPQFKISTSRILQALEAVFPEF